MTIDYTEILEKNFEEILIVLDAIKEQLIVQKQNQEEQTNKIIDALVEIERSIDKSNE